MSWFDHGPRRVNHAAVEVNKKIYSFGGYCTGRNYKTRTPIDISIFDTETNCWFFPNSSYGKSCEQVSVPFQRYGHTVVAYEDGVYLWGGRNDLVACNILYKFDTNTSTWSSPEVSGYIPEARDGHSACIIDNYMYIFGGYEEVLDQFSHDVFRLNLKSYHWEYIYTKGCLPTFRDFHSAVAMKEKMIVFGGRGDENGPFNSHREAYCNKLYVLNTLNLKWSKLPAYGKVPVGRRSHSAFVYKKKLFIFGGYNSILNHHFNDLYCYDFDTCLWTCLKIGGFPPCPRRRQCCVLVGEKVYLFGGTSPDYNSALVLSDQVPPLELINIDVSLKDLNDLYVLDLSKFLK